MATIETHTAAIARVATPQTVTLVYPRPMESELSAYCRTACVSPVEFSRSPDYLITCRVQAGDAPTVEAGAAVLNARFEAERSMFARYEAGPSRDRLEQQAPQWLAFVRHWFWVDTDGPRRDREASAFSIVSVQASA